MATVKDKILQKINPKFLNLTPKLSGDTGSFIDLDCDDSLERGAKNLMMKFFRNQDLCEKNKRNSSQQVTELIVSSTKYNDKNEICEIIKESVVLPFIKNDADDPDRPGRRLQKLKMELQEKMSAKWEEEYRKRVNENKFYLGHKHKKKCSDVEDEGDGDDEEEEEEEEEEKEEVKENCKNFTNEKSGSENTKSKDINEEVIEDDDDDDDDGELGEDEEDQKSDGASDAGNEPNTNNSDDLEKDDEYDDCSLVPAYQPGGGMLYGGSELTQSEEGLPKSLLSPSLSFSMTQLSGSKQTSECIGEETPKKSDDITSVCPFEEKMKLFSQKPNDSFDLNEAFEFCSGRFPDAANNYESHLGSQNQVEEGSDFESECSEPIKGNKTENDKLKMFKTRKNIRRFDDSDAEEEQQNLNNELSENDDEGQQATAKLLSDNDEEWENERTNLRKKKSRKVLHFSDEEDCEEEVVEENKSANSTASDDENCSEVADDQLSVHYDSEENEIINPREFFEKEAEFSGSEWSGDEDEQGMDEFDLEEGDADKLDDDQVRSQLEKIHIRRVLDDDAREVRLIQEILFEDGDLHSDGKRRDRKFKWKNLGAFDGQENRGELVEDGGNSSEEDGVEEEQLRKIRHEKELFLMTKKKNGDLSSDEEIVEDFHSIKVTSVKTSIKVSTNENVIESSKTTSDYSRITKSTNFSKSRGSFLTRNEEFLSRLAKATSGITDNVLGPKNSKNFVFATKSPEKKNQEKTAVCKRQSDDSENSGGREKKMKLLTPEIVTGPSILDLLV